jgi:ELWxxDGT repeat protein
LERPSAHAALWGSAGTAETTLPLDVSTVVWYREDTQPPFAVAGGKAFFAGESREDGEGLWVTDGTVAGTRRLRFPGGLNPSASSAAVWNGRAVFGLYSWGELVKLWTSDGTQAGTVAALAVPPEIDDSITLAGFGNDLYLAAREEGLYHYDGPSSSSLSLLSSEVTFYEAPRFTQAGSQVFFIGENGYQTSVWRTDGTPEGTVPVPLPDGVYSPAFLAATALGSSAVFVADNWVRTVFRSDGTETGSVLLATFPTPYDSNEDDPTPTWLVALGNQVFFPGYDDEHGWELWASDGTPEGTHRVLDLAPGVGGSDPGWLTVARGRLWFAATDPVHGRELWASDGTAAGTHLVQDIAPGALSSSPEHLTPDASGRLWFVADDGLAGREPWLLGNAPGCTPGPARLCLAAGRFAVTASWQEAGGRVTEAAALPLTGSAGAFRFFDPASPELAVKILDGRAVTGSFWTFLGSLTDVASWVTVTDTATGRTERYGNAPGLLGSMADLKRFGPLQPAAATVRLDPDAATGTCQPADTRLCLAGRFAVTVSWTDPSGRPSAGQVAPIGRDAGAVWFTAPDNLELVLKIVDGRTVNGHTWFFSGALTDLGYTLTLTDTVTGTVRTYRNLPGRLTSFGDVGAF